MNYQHARQYFLELLQECEIVDAHSHTKTPATYYAQGPFDLFTLNSYFSRDAAGILGEQPYAGCTDDEQRWQRLRLMLDKGRNITYWRHNIVTYKKYFDLEDDDVTDANWRDLNAAIRQKTADPGWYDYTSRQAVNIKTQIRNIPWFDDWLTAELVAATDEKIRNATWVQGWDARYFTGTLRMENALFLHRIPMVEQLSRRTKTEITNLASLKSALAALVDLAIGTGAVGIKLAHAYFRTLECGPVEDAAAGRVFLSALRGESLDPAHIRLLQDHIIFYLADLCRERKILFQIHTGLQHMRANLADANPLHLIPLLSAYPDVTFDVFHAGIPFIHESAVLLKLFPNTYANLAWVYVISMAMSRQIVSEYIDLIPSHRIIGFGSDVSFPEFIGSHLDMAFACIANVLADKVENDFLSLDAAKTLIRQMLTDNGMELYKL